MTDTLESAMDVQEIEGIAAQLEATNQQVRAMISWALRSPAVVRNRWERLVEHGIRGRSEEVHQVRTRFCDDVDLRIRYLEQILPLAEVGNRVLGQELPGMDRLPHTLAELQRVREEICKRWCTLEDLEDLLAAHYPLTNAELLAIARRHPAPPAWYEEDSKPF